MARIRSIKPAFFTSEDSCRCSMAARLLFLGLLTEADKAGRVEDRPWQLKIRLLPNDDADVDALLWELVERALVRRYEAEGGRRVIQIVNFAKHQKPHPKEAESVLPATGRERKPESSTASRERVVDHPVENPSCPARNGSGDFSNGYGDSGLGVVVPAKPAAPTRSAPLIMSPLQFHKIHGTHVQDFCDWLCFPVAVFEDFVRLTIAAGNDEGEARQQVMAWGLSVRQAWQGRIPGDNIFDFWRNEWKATHGSNKPANGAVDVLAGLR